MGAKEEFAKAECFLAEGEKLYAFSPEQVRSGRFFMLWETFRKPDYFFFEEASFTLAGKTYLLPEGWEDAEGVFRWSEEENAPVLEVSSPDWNLLYKIGFHDGKAFLLEGKQQIHVLHDSRKTDLLECVHYFVRWKLDSGWILDPEKIHKKDFLEGLSALELPKVLKTRFARLPLEEIRELMRKAVADLPEDERGPQMILPLSGNYAPENTAETTILNDQEKISRKSENEVFRMLDFLCRCNKLVMENERSFVLSFENAKIIGKHAGSGQPVLRITAEDILPVYQDDLLRVYRRENNRKNTGMFQVDFYDPPMLIGHFASVMTDDAFPIEEEDLPDLRGVLLRGPFELYAEMLEKFCADLRNGKTFSDTAAGALLGLENTSFHLPSQQEIPPGTPDRAQYLALTAASDPENKLILVQGPPGTGKTFVLEKLLRKFASEGKKVLVAAPSHAAVDNICRRIMDLPFLRCGKNPDNIDPAIREKHWLGDPVNYHFFRESSRNKSKSIIFAGTHAALLKESLIEKYLANYGPFDAVVLDESGMAGFDVILLCSLLAKKAVLFGDHLQLPPFPLPDAVTKALFSTYPRNLQPKEYALLSSRSAMEYLADARHFPVIVLGTSYRCENPRLLRFASTVFYTGNVHPSPDSDYYLLPLPEREKKYPRSTLQWISTSSLPAKFRAEELRLDAGRPGICNPLEANIAVDLLCVLLKRYTLDEITLISPYRRQIHLLRQMIREKLSSAFPEQKLKNYVNTRVNTVDSFQGGENSVIIISYVRSNPGYGIGFTDNPNRVNVAYTRCRKELFIIGDLDALKMQAKNDIFKRMERAFLRDGLILRAEELAAMNDESDTEGCSI